MTVDISSEPVRMGHYVELTVTVADTGMGIKKDDLPTRRSSTLRHKARLAEKQEAKEADKPLRKTDERKPFRKADDHKPFRKAEGGKPFHKADGKKPLRRNESGAKPFRKSEGGAKPFRKTDKKPFRNNRK